jgi:hypothetical protein
MDEATPQTLYHLVRTNPSTDDDFLSQWAKNVRAAQAGEQPRAEPAGGDALHMWGGVSAHDDAGTSREMRQLFPKLGDFIALLQIPPDAPIRVEKTGGNPHHYTIWGAPAALRGCVQSIEPV